jgi:hypothetical protein
MWEFSYRKNRPVQVNGAAIDYGGDSEWSLSI